MRGCRRSARARASPTAAGRHRCAGGARVLASPVVPTASSSPSISKAPCARCAPTTASRSGKSSLGTAVQGTPAVARGRVFVPTIGNNVVALRLADGAKLWTRDVGGMTLSSPTPINGDLIVAAGFPQRHVMRLSGATGEVVWRSPSVMEQFSNTSPAVGAGLVVVGANGGHYYAFDAATGTPRWDYVADGIVHLAAPLIAGGRVYMAGGGKSNRVYAVDAATGAVVDRLADPRWRRRQRTSPGTAARPAAGGVVAGGGRRPDRPADAARRRAGHRRRRPRRSLSVARGAGGHQPGVGRGRLAARSRARRGGRPERRPEVLRLSDARGLRERRRLGAGRRRLFARARGGGVRRRERPGAEPRGHVGGGAGVAGVRQRPPDHGHDGGLHRRAGVEREPRALGADRCRQHAPDRQRRRDAALAARRRSRRRAARATRSASTPTASCSRPGSSRSTSAPG